MSLSARPSAASAPSAAIWTLLLLGAPGCEPSPGAATVPEHPTYHHDIAPLLTRRCLACHRDGLLAPFALETFTQVAPMATRLENAVRARRMPPLPPAQDGDCPPIDDPRVMTDAERETLSRWVADGAPEGDPASRPPAEPPPRTLGPPTDRFPMPARYTSAETWTDDYRCFLIDPELTALTAVSAVSVEPGNRRTVHHASVYVVPPAEVAAIRALDDRDAGPGYTCFGGAGVTQAYPVGLWVPGYDAPTPPPRPTVGFYLPAGWQIVLQNHYNFANERGPDQSTVTLWRAQALVTEIPHALYLSDTTFRLPAGAPSTVRTVLGDVVSRLQTPVLGQVQEGYVYSAWGHMHLLGKSLRMDLVRGDKREQCVLRIPAWDFHWQSAYQLARPVQARPGDQIRLTCEWDNSFARQPDFGGGPQTPRDVTFGERTTDEMCVGTLALIDLPF